MKDVLVIGGGALGMLTARELCAAGASVLLVERGLTGRESSWAGGGILSPLHPWRCADPITQLARWSQRRYPDLAKELRTRTGVDPEWIPSGLLVVDTEEADEARQWSARFGYRLQTLAPEALGDIEPQLAPRHRPAQWMPEVAQIRNPRLVRALRLDLAACGVEVLEHHEVLELAVARERVLGVRTDRGSIQGGLVIVSAGAWTARLLEPLGAAPHITPVCGQMVLLRGQPGLLSRIVLRSQRYLIPRGDGRILVGSTLEHTGFAKAVTAEARNGLVDDAAELVPAVRHLPLEHHWAGLRPGSPNGIPYIGPHPNIRGLFVNAGHFRNGLVLSPASARLIADLVLDRPPIIPPAPFALTAAR